MNIILENDNVKACGKLTFFSRVGRKCPKCKNATIFFLGEDEKNEKFAKCMICDEEIHITLTPYFDGTEA